MSERFMVDREVLVDVVIYHYRTDIKGCRCGWAKLGESWAEHVADVVEERMSQRTELAELLADDASTWPAGHPCRVCGELSRDHPVRGAYGRTCLAWH